ncbi:MAG: hemerythrin family protein [Phycisphaeraceae bacterium]|nr:hemerythrin family protein [Phycisphaeraceae bacterium]
MEPIIWTENYSVGVALFDEQHKSLVGILNKMIEDPTVTTGSETVSDVLTEMTQYALSHFRSEEDLMNEHGYPHLEQHRKQHRTFENKVVTLCSATGERIEDVPQVLLEYLQKWLTQHILCEDMEYKAFFREKGVK